MKKPFDNNLKVQHVSYTGITVAESGNENTYGYVCISFAVV